MASVMENEVNKVFDSNVVSLAKQQEKRWKRLIKISKNK